MRDPSRHSRPPASDTPDKVPDRVLLHMPVDVRSVSLAVLAVLAVVYTLSWAKAVFVPLMLGVIISYALTPAVDRLQRWRLPRSLGISLVLAVVLGGLGVTGWSLADDATALVESLPDAAQKLRQSLRTTRSAPASPIDQVQRAANELEEVGRRRAAACRAPTVA